MITHTIQRWFQKLFAWWPWKNAKKAEYRQVVSSRNGGSGQESLRFGAVDGPITRQGPGTTSVAVEYTANDGTIEVPSSISEEESSEYVPSSHHDLLSTKKDISQDVKDKENDELKQNLEFLRYLVQRGIVNEGFREDQIPEQYGGTRHRKNQRGL